MAALCGHADCPFTPTHGHAEVRLAIPGQETARPPVRGDRSAGGQAKTKATCAFEGCAAWPSYAPEGEKKATHCEAHKTGEMVLVFRRSCQASECHVRPSFAFGQEKTPTHCATHKRTGMVRVKRQCREPGCAVYPTFAAPGAKKATHCAAHRTEGMALVRKGQCRAPGCTAAPTWGLRGEGRATHCAAHRTEAMARLRGRRCSAAGCDVYPSFAHEGERKATHCYVHKSGNMVNVRSKRCKTPLCGIVVSKKYAGYCVRCFVHLYPESPLTRNHKTKERAVDEYLLAAFPGEKLQADRRVAGGCSRRRPDLMADLGSHVVIEETDENQHVSYDCSCENKRLVELWQDAGMRPMVFVRFNPDEYLNAAGCLVASCWGTDSRGLPGVRKAKRAEWAFRLECLRQELAYWLANPPEKAIEVVQLFFDVVGLPRFSESGTKDAL